MKASAAKDLGRRVADLLQNGQTEAAYGLLTPILAERTPFRWLDRLASAIGGAAPPVLANNLLERIAQDRTMGGWVVMAGVLRPQLKRDAAGVMNRCQALIVRADVWYAADIFGERLPGPSLVLNFKPTLDLLAPWRKDVNRWVRRTVGVAIHFWAKRSGGAPDLNAQAETLLTFLEPMFEEWDLDAVKGIGWGLKTLGRFYPELLTNWLARRVIPEHGRIRALMLRKALTNLSDDQRARATGSTS